MTHKKTSKLMLSSVGFKMTPAIEQKASDSLAPLIETYDQVFRIRAKLRFFDNGPRRDTFQVRMRFEQKGPDLVTVQEGHDLYDLIQQVADISISRLSEIKNKRIQSRRKLTH